MDFYSPPQWPSAQNIARILSLMSWEVVARPSPCWCVACCPEGNTTGALTRPTMNSLCRDSSNLHNHSFSQGPWAHQSLLDLRRSHISACRPPSPLTRQRPDLVVRGVPVAHARQDWPASRTEWLACRVGWCMVGGVVGWNRMVGQGGGMLGVVRTRSVRLVIMLGDGPAMGAWV